MCGNIVEQIAAALVFVAECVALQKHIHSICTVLFHQC